MTTETTERDKIVEKLRADRPEVAVSVTWEQDLSFAWDGDGPDPVEDGFVAHDVTVTVTSVRDGELVEGHSHLGGSYSEFGGPHCPDIHGYFPQMLEEAIEELDAELGRAAA